MNEEQSAPSQSFEAWRHNRPDPQIKDVWASYDDNYDLEHVCVKIEWFDVSHTTTITTQFNYDGASTLYWDEVPREWPDSLVLPYVLAERAVNRFAVSHLSNEVDSIEDYEEALERKTDEVLRTYRKERKYQQENSV